MEPEEGTLRHTKLRRRLGAGILGLSLIGGSLAFQQAPAAADDEDVAVGDAGFEDPLVSPDGWVTFDTGGISDDADDTDDWFVTQGTVDLVNGRWAPPPGNPDDASGNQTLDLDGFSRGTVCQDLTTEDNAPHALRFALTRNGDFGPSPSAGVLIEFYDLPIGGPVLLSDETESLSHTDPAEDPWTAEDPNWESHEIEFTSGGSGGTRICFTSQSLDDWVNRGAVIDNVSVTKLNTGPRILFVTPHDTDPNNDGEVDDEYTDGDESADGAANPERFWVGQEADYDVDCIDPDDEDQPVTCLGARINPAGSLVSEIFDFNGPPTAIPTGEDDIGWHTLAAYTADCSGYDLDELSCFGDTPEDEEWDDQERLQDYAVVGTDGACRATGASLLGIRLADANPPAIPCEDDEASLVNTNNALGNPLLGSLRIGAINAETVEEPGLASASSSIADVRLRVVPFLLNLRVQGLESSVVSTLGDDCAEFSTRSSSVAGLTIGTTTYNIGDTVNMEIPLGPLGKIVANHEFQLDDGTWVRRALFVDLPGTTFDIVLGASSSYLHCDALPEGRPGPDYEFQEND